MCGIAGLFLKKGEHSDRLGVLFTPMLACMESRGADSVGLAVYGDEAPPGFRWMTVFQSGAEDWGEISYRIQKASGALIGEPEVIHTHAVYLIPANLDVESLRPENGGFTIASVGRRMRIFKEAGSPTDLLGMFGSSAFRGSHAIGHTRMATESAVLTAGAHPFSTGEDFCLVHNGSLSNHHWVKRRLERKGIRFLTENDSEVAAGYLAWRLREGDGLEEALQSAIRDLDGFYTFCVGTSNGFAVLRDPVACKPAVLAETDDYVAVASEYRSLADLPGASEARIWEPEPGVVYAWEANQTMEAGAS